MLLFNLPFGMMLALCGMQTDDIFQVFDEQVLQLGNMEPIRGALIRDTVPAGANTCRAHKGHCPSRSQYVARS